MSLDSLAPIGDRNAQFIRGNVNYLLDLPHPSEEEWIVAEQPPGVAARLNHLIQRGLIEKEGTTRPGSWHIHQYSTNPQAYRAIQAEAERRRLLPCGHAGIENHGAGVYSCGYEYCDETYDRGVAEEALRS